MLTYINTATRQTTILTSTLPYMSRVTAYGFFESIDRVYKKNDKNVTANNTTLPIRSTCWSIFQRSNADRPVMNKAVVIINMSINGRKDRLTDFVAIVL
jgi:hypothetical protein